MISVPDLPDIGRRARQQIAYRLLPFVFLIYVVNYILAAGTCAARVAFAAMKISRRHLRASGSYNIRS